MVEVTLYESNEVGTVLVTHISNEKEIIGYLIDTFPNVDKFTFVGDDGEIVTVKKRK